MNSRNTIRILYSFPHKIGASRICNIAWHQVAHVAAGGARVTVFPGVIHRPLPGAVTARPTLARGTFRIPYRALGTQRACALHDWVVARRVERMRGRIDVIHAWPLGALQTFKVARRFGIACVLERPNAHTELAFEAVRRECEQLGVAMPKGHDHEYNPAVLSREREEYDLADALLCPSAFVKKTFLDRGFPAQKLAEHQYSYDESVFYPSAEARVSEPRGLNVLFAGECTPRKGLHYALAAWKRSPISKNGVFQIAGEFMNAYREKLAPELNHPNIAVLGQRSDLADIMRKADIFILPSVEEGSALVTSEARACGCVLAVSDATGAVCTHMENGLVHQARDVETLANQLTALDTDRDLLRRLRDSSLRTIHQLTWRAAGARLLAIYRDVLAAKEGVVVDGLRPAAFVS